MLCCVCMLLFTLKELYLIYMKCYCSLLKLCRSWLAFLSTNQVRTSAGGSSVSWLMASTTFRLGRGESCQHASSNWRWKLWKLVQTS